MRTPALLLALLAVAGCKSGRDYTSANKGGYQFLFETFREGNQLRKKNLKQDFAFSQRAPQAKMIRKTSRKFAWQSFWREEWSGFKEIWNARKVESKPKGERMDSIRFGMLDSGE
jgi:hypothetical protein